MLAVAALYKFVALPDFAELQAPLKALCDGLAIKGSLLLAPEGVNGTVAGAPEAVDALLAEFRSGPLFGGRLTDLEAKLSTADAEPFGRMKVRLKKEIVTLGDPEARPAELTGTFVDPADWNDLISRDDIVLVDVRNGFEVAMGSFDGALDPQTKSFGDFRRFAAEQLSDKSQTVAMFCTGGIRCEKASAHLLAQGFADVRQLKGGILKYLEEVPAEASLWRGSCFVFDERVALGHGLVAQAPESADV